MSGEQQSAEIAAISDDPPGIDPSTHDLPTVPDASERVAAFLRWYGDGRVFPDTDEDGPPLYARDLEALCRAAMSLRPASTGGASDA